MSRLNPLKDATNILKALFKKHDVFTIKAKDKANCENEQWS